MSKPSLACVAEASSISGALQSLVSQLQIPVYERVAQIPNGIHYYLSADEQHQLQLVPVDKKQGGALLVDFTAAEIEYRRQHSGIRQDIAKAVGCKPQYRPRLLDATAGLGGDAFVLASLGCHVTLIEQNPVVYALLADGLKRGRDSDGAVSAICTQQMDLLPLQSSVDYLGYCEPEVYQVIYLDPMFPERKKSAKVKKGMQYFHDIVGLDHQQEQMLLSEALRVAEKRVVVKRPKQAPLLANKSPSYQLKGKAVRYDIYVNS